MAISEAKRAYEDFEERLDIYTKASVKRAPMDYGQMILWVSAPLTKWDPVTAAKETAVIQDPPF